MVTIIIPTYNRLDLLKEAYYSCKKQTVKDFDLIVTDNASIDGSREFIQEVMNDNIITELVLHKSNIGATANIENALKLVKTKWITILCDDDTLEINFIEKTINTLRNTKGSLVITGFNTINQHNNIKSTTFGISEYLNRDQYLQLFLNGKIQIAGISAFFFLKDGLDINKPLKNYPKGFLVDTMLCVESGLQQGCEIISDCIYNRLSWYGSESAFSIENLKQYFNALLLFNKDLSILINTYTEDKQTIMQATSPQSLNRFFRIIILKTIIQGSMNLNDIKDFFILSKTLDKWYYLHVIMIVLFYPIMTKITFSTRQNIFNILRKIKRKLQ